MSQLKMGIKNNGRSLKHKYRRYRKYLKQFGVGKPVSYGCFMEDLSMCRFKSLWISPILKTVKRYLFMA